MGVLKLLNKTKADVYITGGYVRDFIRKRKNTDLDIVVRNMDLTSIEEFLSRYGSAKFVTVAKNFNEVAIILFRASGDILEAQIALPRTVGGTFSQFNSLKDDAKCRDVTINAMYLPIDYKSRIQLIDSYGGYRDVKKRIIRAVNDPGRRIKESPVRIMRVISLAARTQYRIHKLLMESMKGHRNLLRNVPVENIRDELDKVLTSRKPSRYFKIMKKLGILEIIMPELYRCIGVRQDRRYHKYDVFNHCLYTCDFIEPNLVLRLAALLHDIGKPPTRHVGGGRITFHKHELAGADLADKLLVRLRYDGRTISEIKHLIRLHMYHYTRDFSDAAVRRFIKRANIEEKDLEDLGNIPLFKLRKAERQGNGFKTIPVTERQLDFENRIVEVYKASKGFNIKDLNIDGDTIMSVFNMKPSPEVGDLLNYLVEQILAEPKLNNRTDLLRITAEYLYNKTLERKSKQQEGV